MPAKDATNSQEKLDHAESSPVVGLISVGLAGTDLFALTATLALAKMGPRFSNLSTVFGWLWFDYAFPLFVLASLLAIVAICLGGRNRRMGFLALGSVACTILMAWLE